MSKIQLNGNQYCVIIPDSVISLLREFEQVGDKDEAGGILLGKVAYREEQVTIALTDISTPSKVDFRSRFKFIRKKEPAQKLINQQWEMSKGLINYVGEWHTHPEKNPIPSTYDKKMIKRTNNGVKSDLDFTLMLIVGIHNTLWLGVRNKKELITLN